MEMSNQNCEKNVMNETITVILEDVIPAVRQHFVVMEYYNHQMEIDLVSSVMSELKMEYFEVDVMLAVNWQNFHLFENVLTNHISIEPMRISQKKLQIREYGVHYVNQELLLKYYHEI